MMWIIMSRILVTIVYFALVLIWIWIMMWIMICKVSSNFFKCYIELVTIVLKFCTYELFDMDNGVDYYMYS